MAKANPQEITRILTMVRSRLVNPKAPAIEASFDDSITVKEFHRALDQETDQSAKAELITRMLRQMQYFDIFIHTVPEPPRKPKKKKTTTKPKRPGF